MKVPKPLRAEFIVSWCRKEWSAGFVAGFMGKMVERGGGGYGPDIH